MANHWTLLIDMFKVTAGMTGDMWQNTYYSWQLTGDRWQVTGYRWYLAGDSLQVTNGMWPLWLILTYTADIPHTSKIFTDSEPPIQLILLGDDKRCPEPQRPSDTFWGLSSRHHGTLVLYPISHFKEQGTWNFERIFSTPCVSRVTCHM